MAAQQPNDLMANRCQTAANVSLSVIALTLQTTYNTTTLASFDLIFIRHYSIPSSFDCEIFPEKVLLGLNRCDTLIIENGFILKK